MPRQAKAVLVLQVAWSCTRLLPSVHAAENASP